MKFKLLIATMSILLTSGLALIGASPVSAISDYDLSVQTIEPYSSGTGVAVTNDNVCIKTIAAGTRTLVTSNSILVRDRTVQLSQNATTAMILASKNLSVRVSG